MSGMSVVARGTNCRCMNYWCSDTPTETGVCEECERVMVQSMLRGGWTLDAVSFATPESLLPTLQSWVPDMTLEQARCFRLALVAAFSPLMQLNRVPTQELAGMLDHRDPLGDVDFSRHPTCSDAFWRSLPRERPACEQQKPMSPLYWAAVIALIALICYISAH